jgi:hypothetical protein
MPQFYCCRMFKGVDVCLHVFNTPLLLCVYIQMQVSVLVCCSMLQLHDLALETRVTHVCLSAQDKGNNLTVVVLL